MTEEERTTMRVILCKPDERAVFIEMEDSLEAMQSMVGGLIEEYMPWDDEVALICNEEGKMNGLPLNRGIKDEDGHLQDIIAGDFFICYASIASWDEADLRNSTSDIATSWVIFRSISRTRPASTLSLRRIS